MQNNNEAAAEARNACEVIIVGGGFAGIGAAIKLKQAGFDFLLLEKADEIGGVWRENSYPGCACDIPSALYSYSFAPNPDWQRMFAGQQEIKQYTLDTAARFGVQDRILLQHEVLESRWDAAAGQWQLQTNQGHFRARFVIMACGPMHKPVFPTIPGMESFAGHAFHSAQWDHGYDLTDKKVAIIGSGASAIQFLPEIQPQVKEIALFQRTPPWVLPKMDRAISDKWRQRFSRFPFLQRALRRVLAFQFEFLNSGLKRKGFIRRMQGVAIGNMHRAVKDPALRKTLVPDYDIGCKRILQSNNWYPALARDNVNVLGGVERIDGNTLVDQDGHSCQADVIIFATGFEVANPPVADIIVGAKGETLASQWQGSPEVYIGTLAKDCPNLFLTFGPNLYYFTSAFVIIEAQLDYILDALKTARDKQLHTVAIKDEVCDQYNTKLQAALQQTVWNSGGCTSYFIDKNGRNSTNWPWATRQLRRALKRFDASSCSVQ